jgi:hypothetical protein
MPETTITKPFKTTEEWLTDNGYFGGFPDESSVNVSAWDEGVAKLAAGFVALKQAEDDSVSAKAAMADAIIALRNSVTYLGKPDTFALSDAYRTLYRDRLIPAVLAANPGMDNSWARTELAKVKTNYVNGASKGAKDILMETIVREAAESGALGPNAKVQKDGTVLIAQTKKGPDGTQVPVMVKTKDADGNQIEVQKIATYVPRQTVNVPKEIKAAVQAVIKDRAGTKKGPDGTQVPRVAVPARFGGAAKDDGSGGGKPKGPADWAKQYRASLDSLTDSLGTPEKPHLNSLQAFQWFHASATAFVDHLNALNGKGKLQGTSAEHAVVAGKIAALFGAESSVLEGAKPLETLDPFRYVPTDEETKTTVKSATEEAADETADEEAADEEAAA